MNIYYLLLLGFNLWMLVDAVRRKAEYYWYLIILLVPFGGLVYFVLVKVRDFGRGAGRPALSLPKRPSVAQLREQVQESPSAVNKLGLADALEQRSEFPEAENLYRSVLKNDPSNLQALHGLGRARMGQGDPDGASEAFALLVDLDNRYRDYEAALEYAEALWAADQRDVALEVLAAIAANSGRINHQLAQAHYLHLANENGRAREVLERALLEFEQSPAFVQKRDAEWAKKAQQLLQELG